MTREPVSIDGVGVIGGEEETGQVPSMADIKTCCLAAPIRPPFPLRLSPLVISRALLKSIAGGIGAAPAGRGRGRGSTMPAWMTHPGGPGGLQESSSGSKAVGGVDLKERSRYERVHWAFFP